jgi:hypothetical protein
MKSDVVGILLVVLVTATGLGVGYLAGSEGRQSTTITSVSTLTALQTSTTTTTLEQTASIVIANASVPASAWSPYSPSSILQCGYAQPSGSGSITLTNKGDGPVSVGDLIIYLGYGNQTEYLVSAIQSGQSCTISPSGSLTLYFSFLGPVPPDCQGFVAYISLGNGYDISFSGSIGTDCWV